MAPSGAWKAAATCATSLAVAAVAYLEWERRYYDREIEKLAAERRRLERADAVEAADVLRGVDVWSLKGEYYQVLGHAWNHEKKDFDVVYRPLYHCEAAEGRFEAHVLAVSHFARWEAKFERVADLATLPPAAAALLLPGPFWHDPLWTLSDRAAPRAGATRSGLGSRSHEYASV